MVAEIAPPTMHFNNSGYAVAKPTHISSVKNPSTKPVTTVANTQPKVTVTPPPHQQPVTAAAATYASGCLTYDSLFRQYDWNVNVAEAICQAESGGNPYAYSSTADAGLMQIHDGLYLYGSQIYNPSFNIAKAYDKYLKQGWGAWTTYNTGAYARYL